MPTIETMKNSNFQPIKTPRKPKIKAQIFNPYIM